MRFVATADWQLGMTAHFLDAEVRPRFHQARFDAVRAVAELATERKAQFVVVGGDIFETNQLDRAIIFRALEALRTFTVPVVLLPGNHDPLDAASIYDDPAFTSRQPDHVHVIREPGIYDLAPGIEIVGAPWTSKRPLGDLIAAATTELEVVPAGTIRVVLGHGAVASLNPDRDSLATIDERHLRGLLDDGKAHAVILGDRHGTFEVAPGIWYPGAPEVTARREINPGNALVVDVADPVGGARSVQVETIRVGTWTFETLERVLHGSDDLEQFAADLAEVPNKERTALWLALTGTLSTRDHARLVEVLDEFRDTFARLEFWERETDLVVQPEDSDFSQLGLSGFAEDALAELTELAGAGNDEARTAQDALGLLYRFVNSSPAGAR